MYAALKSIIVHVASKKELTRPRRLPGFGMISGDAKTDLPVHFESTVRLQHKDSESMRLDMNESRQNERGLHGWCNIMAQEGEVRLCEGVGKKE